jgi:hypothetical protein
MSSNNFGRPGSPKYATDAATYPAPAICGAPRAMLSPPSEPPSKRIAGCLPGVAGAQIVPVNVTALAQFAGIAGASIVAAAKTTDANTMESLF